MAGQPTSPLTYPPRNNGLIRPYQGKPRILLHCISWLALDMISI